MADNEFILEVKNVSKSFPGVKALNSVNLNVRKGTIHALMGENGAGKSTLMKILIGIYTADEGEVWFKGKRVNFQNTNEALHSGISMIHQELNPVPYMTVAENIFLGKEPLKFFGRLVDFEKINQKTKELLDTLEIAINPKSKMVDLSVGQMQMIEIAKAISYDADLIIMDEPTSAITEREVAHLFRIVEKLRKDGVAIVFITHKMDEVFKITDYTTVFRDGQFIGEKATKELKKEDLIQMMVGREIDQLFPKQKAEIGEVVLSVQNLTRNGIFEDLSFDLRKGEILGFAGLIGSGRTEVLECLFGVTQKTHGRVFLKGKEIEIRTPRDVIKQGMALLTEDRKLTGLYLVLSVLNNIIMANIKEYEKYGLLNNKEMRKAGLESKQLLQIKTPSLEQLVLNLSGGNQQKVLVARWLLTQPDILILDEPTRGIDVGAKAEIHRLMSGLAQEGKSIIMVSSEMPEILGMSDRILVMHEGKKSGELLRSEATQEKILHLATGESLDTFDESQYK